jgi:hypothetical protein
LDFTTLGARAPLSVKLRFLLLLKVFEVAVILAT